MQRERRLDIDMALACGYYDVSHMLKDLTYFLGAPPKLLVHAVRTVVDKSIGH